LGPFFDDKQTTEQLAGIVENIQWYKQLISHFPTYFLDREAQYIQVSKRRREEE
jgi:hypothetical protein